MEWMQHLLDGTTMPIVTAFLLGLLTAVSPCPMATNITAIGFISKDIENRHRIFRNGLLYTVGRIVAYAGIGLLFIPLLRQGASVYGIQKAIAAYGQPILAPVLILIGVFMLVGHRLNLPKLGLRFGSEKFARRGGWGAFLLGILFSLAFCPSSGVLYFGVLMPLAAAETGGYLLPVVYAVATGLPVVVSAWVLAYSVSQLGRFYNRMQLFQKGMNLLIALLFIGVGVYYAIMI